MVNYKYIAILLFFLLLNNVSAQKRNTQSLIFWGDAGYFNILNNADNIKSYGRIGVDIGAGYELKFSNFIIHTGAELMLGNSFLNLNDFVHEENLIDTEGDPYVGKFYFTDNRDRNLLGYVNVPVMLGFEYSKMYFMAGGKIGFNIFGNSSTQSSIRSTGKYPQFIEEFENMPNHFFGTSDERNDYSVRTKINFTASAEIGITFKPALGEKSRSYSRLALFCDYGLSNIKDESYNENPIIYKDGFVYQPIMNSIMRSEQLSENRLSTLFIGVKYTLVFNLKEKRDCMCMWE